MKKTKLYKLMPVFLLLPLLLSGCVQRTKSGKPYGFVYDHLAIPTQHALEWLANVLGGSYGWSIILITFIVRLVLMPIMLKQSHNATIQQEKMASIRPQMMDIQERQKRATTQEEKMAISQEMMALYKENNISMTGGIGCLPLLIQMPIFAALYAAIQYSPELSSSVFYGINLGQRSLFFVILTVVIYALQGWLTTLGMPEEQKKQMQSMMLINPVMMAFMAYVSPAALGLYFFVGGIIACIQTLIINAMRPKIRQKVAAELKANPPKKVVAKVTPTKPVSSASNNQKTADMHANNRKRNAGKQQRRK
ncbi:membrane protein insertase YidC [Ligilactobacillus sp. Marseille-Q7487]|uniref:membrane protein insertase YidC n=1 Tax=Ligilactobacillus sp. Marseille-Q7487 TaxID=3022128 RepID=UPI0024A96A1D|nr:membrane protein insertase YidC [Ligilactobacillus sp. Marseille-Q7487]